MTPTITPEALDCLTGNEKYEHLLDMLGAKDHQDAGRVIGQLHAAKWAAPAAAGVPDDRDLKIIDLENAVAAQRQTMRDMQRQLMQPAAQPQAEQQGAGIDRYSVALEEFASRHGGPDGREGLLEFYARKHYAQGREDAARQPVGEPVAFCEPDNPHNSSAFAWPGTDREPRHVMPLYTAPPAQGVDLGQFREAVYWAANLVTPKPPAHFRRGLSELLAMIDSQHQQESNKVVRS